jgi:hypothetical protein
MASGFQRPHSFRIEDDKINGTTTAVPQGGAIMVFKLQ